MGKTERRLDAIPFDRQKYLRRIVRERIGCIVQQAMYHALAAVMAEEGTEVSTHRQIVTEAAIDDLIWQLEEAWKGESPPAGPPPIAAPPKRKPRKGGGTVLDNGQEKAEASPGLTPGIVSCAEETANGTPVPPAIAGTEGSSSTD